MKNLVLILLIIVLNAQVGTCQKIHFCDTTNQWADTLYDPVAGTFGWMYITNTGMTETYGIKTYYEFNFNVYVAGLPDWISGYIRIREDTTEGKVFICDVYDGTLFEHVLYDYTLHQGDTFFNRTFFTADSLRFVVLRLDTTVISGIAYKKFTVKQIDSTLPVGSNPGWDTVYTYIEGIGSTNGPLLNYGYWEFMPYISKLRCFYNNYSNPPIDSLSYLDDDLTDTAYFSNCVDLKINEPVANDKQIEIYPNPTTGNLTALSTQAGSFEVYTVTGQQIGSYVISVGATTLQLPGVLASGVYIGSFRPEGGGKLSNIRIVLRP